MLRKTMICSLVAVCLTLFGSELFKDAAPEVYISLRTVLTSLGQASEIPDETEFRRSVTLLAQSGVFPPWILQDMPSPIHRFGEDLRSFKNDLKIYKLHGAFLI